MRPFPFLRLACLYLTAGLAGCLPTTVAHFDADGDGAADPAHGGTDCDDADPGIHEGAAENCDDRDNDCDGLVDEDFADTDDDGVPDCRGIEVCDGLDNDGDARIDEGFPDADADRIADCIDVEACDGLDNNGDGAIDEGFDEDDRGGPDCSDDDGDGQTEADGDCDDDDPRALRGAPYDLRDGEDTDCDGTVDEANPLDRAPASFEGEHSGNSAGATVIDAGDLDGDGFHDLLIAAHRASSETLENIGRVYLIRGGTLPEGLRSLVDADAIWEGATVGEQVGTSLAALGDVNADGLDDVLVGADGADYNGVNGSGRAYLVLGRHNGFSGTSSVAEIASATFVGRSDFDYLGAGVAGPGDADEDGYADLLIGAPGVDVAAGEASIVDAGEAYVFRGGAGAITGIIPVAAAYATLRGTQTSEGVGRVLAGAGDVNGDGAPDLLLGVPGYDVDASTSSGAAHLVLGGPALHGTFSLDGDDVPFATFTGVGSGENAGFSVCGPGDLDGDGSDDLAIGAPITPTQVGQVYLLYGGAKLEPGLRSLSEADAVLTQTAASLLGEGIAPAGDIDGDGRADLLVTAPAPNVPGGNIPVNVYLVRGDRYDTSIRLDKSAALTFQGSYLGGTADLFHQSIAGIDLDGDGRPEIAVGVAVKSLPDPGNVYVYPGY